MDIIVQMADCEVNASPPTNSYDFDVGRVGTHKIYLTALGKPCQYMNILGELDEDAFITPSGSEETELSSDESVSSKESSKRNISILSTSAGIQKLKEEKLSDSEDSKISKTKAKSSKQSPPKAKKWPVVDYSDSDYSDEDKHTSRRKKHLNDCDDDRPKARGKNTDYAEDRFKSRHKKHSDSSDEDRSKSRRKKYSNCSDEERLRYRRRKYSDCSDEDRSQNYRNKGAFSKYMKREELEEPEYKYNTGMTAAFGSFHCHVCDIMVNSEVTYQTHLQGKKHQKNLKAKAVPELVIQSMNEPRIPPRIQPPVVNAAVIPFKKPKHVPLKVESLIQRVAEDYKDGPLPGLDEVVEVRPPVEGVKDISYLCKLCEAQCVPNSIMKHLTGFKHYLRFLEKIDVLSYERYRYIPKKQIEGKVRRILLDYEHLKGRGKICVEKELVDGHSKRDEPGPSWREDKPPPPPPPALYDDEDEVQFVSAAEHLDTSMSDFYCRACDAHMNNQAMWESHVRGKRHLKNIKKVPGESTTKIKSVQCTGETAHLMKIINELDDKDEIGNDIVIVGLGYMKETQNEAGDLYNCYLCGACTSSYDVIDHLNQSKHKIKYLEEMNAKGYSNGIEQIKAFSGFSSYSKDCMINDECRKCLEKYGEGKVVVYRSKNLYTPSFSSRL